jgi:hypothetical protein
MANRAMAAKVKRAKIEAHAFHQKAAFPEMLITMSQPSKAEVRAMIEASNVAVVRATKRPARKRKEVIWSEVRRPAIMSAWVA